MNGTKQHAPVLKVQTNLVGKLTSSEEVGGAHPNFPDPDDVPLDTELARAERDDSPEIGGAAVNDPFILPVVGLRRAHPNPDQELNRALAEHQAHLHDWTFRGFNLAPRLTQALRWYGWLRIEGLLPSHWRGLRLELPEYIRITFEPRPAPEQGSYTFRRASRDGTRWNININPTSIIEYRRSAAETAATLCHNVLHLYEDQFLQQAGKNPQGSYHSAEFRRNASLIGIPCTRDGAEYGIVAGSRFDHWLERHGIARVFDYAEQPDVEATRPKLPKRISWRCECEDAVAVMVPRASRFHAVCQDCLHFFRPVSPGRVGR